MTYFMLARMEDTDGYWNFYETIESYCFTPDYPFVLVFSYMMFILEEGTDWKLECYRSLIFNTCYSNTQNGCYPIGSNLP